MKHIVWMSLLLFCYEGYLMAYIPLASAPKTIEQFHEIATQYNSSLADLYNSLSPQERVFAYYMFRACLPGNRIAADQAHRHALPILELSELLFLNEKKLKELQLFSHDDQHEQFVNELKTYLVLLWANHSQYFSKEHANEKRTPSRMNLTLLTKENIKKAVALLQKDDLLNLLEQVDLSLFDQMHEHTNCIANSIQKSAVNFYSHDFTDEDYQVLPPHERTHLNAYYYIKNENNQRIPAVERYRIDGKYSQELSIAAYWLEKALNHVRSYPMFFDQSLVESIEHMITFLHTGDEEDFRKHSIA